MKHSYLKNVTTLMLVDENCIGCAKCVEVCPRGVFSVSGQKARIKNKDLCMECGACVKNCPVNTLSVDANVGCASAVIMGWLTGSEPSCDCSGGECC